MQVPRRRLSAKKNRRFRVSQTNGNRSCDLTKRIGLSTKLKGIPDCDRLTGHGETEEI